MKIFCKINCWTPSPERKWNAGEAVDVSDEIGEKLLLNGNFVKAFEPKPEAESENKENVKYRTKRSNRGRN